MSSKLPKCGAITRAPGSHDEPPGRPCAKEAGWGTDHVGYGRCRYHGGTSPTHRAGAAKLKAETEAAKAVATLGLPRDIEPVAALLEEVRRAAGIVAWLADRVAALPEGELHRVDGQALTRLYGEERDRLARVAKFAVDSGVAERQIGISQQQGALLAIAIRGILHSLELTADQEFAAPKIVRWHLTVADAGGGEHPSHRRPPRVSDLQPAEPLVLPPSHPKAPVVIEVPTQPVEPPPVPDPAVIDRLRLVVNEDRSE